MGQLFTQAELDKIAQYNQIDKDKAAGTYSSTKDYSTVKASTSANDNVYNTDNAYSHDYSSSPTVIGNTTGQKDPQAYIAGLNPITSTKQQQTWTDNKGNVYDTTNMTNQQVLALQLAKENNPNAFQILKGMGLDINGNPTTYYNGYSTSQTGASTPTPSNVATTPTGTTTTGTKPATGGVGTGGTTAPVTGSTTAPANTVGTGSALSNRYKPDADANERLDYFKSNPQAALQEIQIVKDMYEKEKADGASAARLNDIHKWANQVRAVAGIADDNVAGSKATSGGFDASSVQGLLNQLKASANTTMTDAEKQRAASLDFLKQYLNSNLESQKANLTSDRDNNLTNILKAYQAAVGSNNQAITQANSDYNGQLSQIAKQAYENSQMRNIVGGQRGIGNSQQFLGMQATDDQLVNDANNAARSGRDKTIADLQSRITGLTTQRDLDTANINNQYNSAITSAGALSQSQLAQAMYESANKSIDDRTALNNALNSQEFQTLFSQLNTQQQQAFQKELLALNNSYDMQKLGAQQNFSLAQMDKAQQQDLEKMATQFGYTKQLQQMSADSQAQLAAISQSGKLEELKAKLKEENDGYDQAVQRELAKYTPGTPEYKIREAQLKDASDNNRQEVLNKAVNDIYVESVVKDSNFSSKAPTPVNNPYTNAVQGGDWSVGNIWNMIKDSAGNLFGDNAFDKEKQYNSESAAYQRYLDLLSGKLPQ